MMMLTAAEWQIVALSCQVACWAMLCNLPLAIVLGWLLARYQFSGKFIIEAMIQLPLVLPPVVLGYFLLELFGINGLIGQQLASLGIQLAFAWQGAVLAAAVVALPLMVQPIRLAFSAIARPLEQTAQTLGANRWQVFYSISLPLALPGILMAAILGFSRSLGEFGATITFVGNIPGETQTLPLAIYALMQQPDGDAAARRLVWLAVAISLLAMLLHHGLAARWQRWQQG